MSSFFRTMPGKNSVSILKLRNVTKKRIAYKIKTTSPKTYIVKPNQGILQVGQKIEIEFTLQTQELNLINGNLSDKFMIQAFEIDDGFDLNRFTEQASELMKRNQVQSMKVRATLNKEGNGPSMTTPDRGTTTFTSPPNRATRMEQMRMSSPNDDHQRSSFTSNAYSALGGGPTSLGESQSSGVNGLFHSTIGGMKETLRTSVGGVGFDFKKEYDKLLQKVEEQEKMLFKLSEERNQFFIELTNLRENSGKRNNKSEEYGFMLWQVIMVAVISIIVGAFLSAA